MLEYWEFAKQLEGLIRRSAVMPILLTQKNMVNAITEVVGVARQEKPHVE